MCDLIRRIERAFADVEYPGEENLTESVYGEEPGALVDDFRGKTDWTVLDPQFLNQAPGGWGSALSFFSAAALHFYLPAYLIADIRGDLQIDGPSSRLCTFVTPQSQGRRIAKAWGGGTLGEHARREYALFDTKQVSAIVAYLWWKLDVEGSNLLIEQALENYWLPREDAINNR